MKVRTATKGEAWLANIDGPAMVVEAEGVGLVFHRAGGFAFQGDEDRVGNIEVSEEAHQAAGVPCDPQCVGWHTSLTNTDEGSAIERCDSCAIFESDDDAANAAWKAIDALFGCFDGSAVEAVGVIRLALGEMIMDKLTEADDKSKSESVMNALDTWQRGWNRKPLTPRRRAQAESCLAAEFLNSFSGPVERGEDMNGGDVVERVAELVHEALGNGLRG